MIGVLIVGVQGIASADTLFVRQDGSGDYLTITDAVTAALDGDVLDIGPGSYFEWVFVDKSISLLGSSGAAVTIIDGSGSGVPLTIEGFLESDVEGLTITNGMGGQGGGLKVGHGPLVTARDCVFSNNVSTFDGGGVFCVEAHLRLIDCEISGNHASHNGGAGNVIWAGILDLDGCVVRDNTCGVLCAGTAADHSSMNVQGCLYLDNNSSDVGGGVYYYVSFGIVRSSTFVSNSGPGNPGATITIQDSPSTQVLRCIIAQDDTGYGMRIIGTPNERSCNLLWDNQDGPIFGDSLRPDEVIADPMFCDPDSDVYSLYDISPAAPEHSSCGELIGAFPVACSVTAVESASFSTLKSLY